MDSFKDLRAWRRAMEMVVSLYRLTESFPSSERYGLTSQLRRAGVSVPSNIAEGYGRSGRGEYVLFLCHARGSNSEVETQLEIAKALGFGGQREIAEAESLCADVGRLLGALIRSLKS